MSRKQRAWLRNSGAKVFGPLMMSTYSEQAFQEKIARLSLSQDSIETLSLWVLQHKAHADEAVKTWLGEVKRGEVM